MGLRRDLSTASQLTFADWYFKIRCYCRALNVRKDCCEILAPILLICCWQELWFQQLGSLWFGRSIEGPHSFGSETYCPSEFARKVWQKQGKKSPGPTTAECLWWPQTSPTKWFLGPGLKASNVTCCKKADTIWKPLVTCGKSLGYSGMDLLIQERINSPWLGRVPTCSRTRVSKAMKNLALMQQSTPVTWD